MREETIIIYRKIRMGRLTLGIRSAEIPNYTLQRLILQQTVILESCIEPTENESYGLANKIFMYNNEITLEGTSKRYTKKKHSTLVECIQENFPVYYENFKNNVILHRGF